MKRFTIITCLLICWVQYLIAQEVTTNTISITTNFLKGDTLKYIIEEGKKKYVNEKIVDSVVTEKRMKLIVVDSTEKGFLIQIDMENDHKTDDLLKDFLQDESNFSFLYSIKDLKLQYRISPVGVFEGFQNMDILKEIMKKTFDFYFAKSKIEPQKAEKLKNTFSKDQILQSMLGKYVSLLHVFHGFEYKADTITAFENSLPNFFSSNGESIPAKGEFLIEYSDTTGIYAEIQQTTIADKKAMRSFMKDAGDVFSFDKKMKREMKNIELNLFQKITCEYHIPSGAPTYLFFRKVVEFNEKGKDDININLDYIEITLE